MARSSSTVEAEQQAQPTEAMAQAMANLLKAGSSLASPFEQTPQSGKATAVQLGGWLATSSPKDHSQGGTAR